MRDDARYSILAHPLRGAGLGTGRRRGGGFWKRSSCRRPLNERQGEEGPACGGYHFCEIG